MGKNWNGFMCWAAINEASSVGGNEFSRSTSVSARVRATPASAAPRLLGEHTTPCAEALDQRLLGVLDTGIVRHGDCVWGSEGGRGLELGQGS